jgi:hypothetical protein
MEMKMVRYQFTKIFTKGNLSGIRYHESMRFVDHKAAQKWFETINQIKTLDYKVEDFMPQ